MKTLRIILAALFIKAGAGQTQVKQVQFTFPGFPKQLFTVRTQPNTQAFSQRASVIQPQSQLISRIQLQELQQPRTFSAADLAEEEWKEYKLTYGKTYPTEEIENLRRGIFIENRGKIALFNQDFTRGLNNFVQKMNAFGDMLFQEFHRSLNGFKRLSTGTEGYDAAPFKPTTFIPSANVPLPEKVDWREVGAVSPVKHQKCAACWAYASAGALEGHNFRKTGNLTEVSVQNLLDCSRSYGNDGCQGGFITPSYNYVKGNDGVDGEDYYPTEGTDNACRFKREGVVATSTGYVFFHEGDEKSVEVAVATIGPVSAAISVIPSLQFYSKGVYFDPACRNTKEDVNHAVLIVGYGVEENGQKYWLIKNSYGSSWGNNGYIKMAKDADNHCGIATLASFPLV